ncbi:hypothetical protein [Flaviaesturariibacter amylovorans]|uniref:hypothetical protein n=1 Tax=Flaviaesturariibacter amylovorans TaxID=1084520 RepID=UPI0031EA57BB
MDFVYGRFSREPAANEIVSAEGLSNSLLARLRLNVLSQQVRVMELLNEQVSFYDEDYDVFSAIVGQNSNALHPEEQLIINAGVGSFARKAVAGIRINGRLVAIGPDGQAVDSIRVGSTAGSYSIPVGIGFTDQDGKRRTVTKEVEYRVLRP